MSYTSVDIVNRALLGLGANPLASFDDGSTEANTAKVLYPQIRDELLAGYQWSFAETKSTLVRESVAASEEFKYSYVLPLDCIRVLRLIDIHRPAFKIFGRSLCVDFDTAAIAYLRRVPEQHWPPFFAAAVAARMRAEMCIPITEDDRRARDLFALADDAMRMARNLDAQQDTPDRFREFNLVDVRGY